MTLTEQWKKGELKSGWYYVNFYSVGAVMQEYLSEHNGFGYDEKNLIQEVLAPVPSYEEWQDTENRSLLTTEFSNEIDELNEENQQLKELLKECEEVLLSYSNINGDYELYDKITNAIGEKK